MNLLRGGRAAAIAFVVIAATAGTGMADPVAPLLDAIAWYSPPPPRLLDDPFAALARPHGGALDVEWAPLYRGPGGERLELGREMLHVGGRRGSWSAAAEVEGERLDMDGSNGPLIARTEIPGEHRITAGIAHSGSRHHLGVAAGIGTSGVADGAAAFEWKLAPGWRTEWRAASESHRGGIRVMYGDAVGEGQGSWADRRLGWRLEGSRGRARWNLALESLDRGADPSATFAHPLAWREQRMAAFLPAGGVDWTLEFEHGAGHERFELLQGGVPYARVTTPLSSSRVALGLSSRHSPVGVRLWSGRWSGAPDGTLRLWAFDGLAAMAGSRQVVRSSASLTHAGLALDARPRTGLEAGLAAWWIRPDVSYESWLAPVMGLGRENVRHGELDVRSAWLAGLRVAARTELLGLAWRLEAIQWAPLVLRRDAASPAAGGGAPGGEPGSGGAVSPDGATWGGTVLRFGVAIR